MSSYRCKVRYTIDLFTFEKSIVVEADSPENARDEASYKASEGPPSIYRTDDQGWGGEGWEEVTEGGQGYTETDVLSMERLAGGKGWQVAAWVPVTDD